MMNQVGADKKSHTSVFLLDWTLYLDRVRLFFLANT